MLSTKQAIILILFYWASVAGAFIIGHRLPDFLSELHSIHADFEERRVDVVNLKKQIDELKRQCFRESY